MSTTTDTTFAIGVDIVAEEHKVRRDPFAVGVGGVEGGPLPQLRGGRQVDAVHGRRAFVFGIALAAHRADMNTARSIAVVEDVIIWNGVTIIYSHENTVLGHASVLCC